MERVILDSSVWIALERGDIELDDAIPDGYELVLPAMVLAELKIDSLRLQREGRRNQQALDLLSFIQESTEFAPFDEKVVEKYVELLFHCQREGVPRSVQDLMIAATAVAHGALLKSFDSRANFEELPNVRVLS